jgi:hypothetical protein
MLPTHFKSSLVDRLDDLSKSSSATNCQGASCSINSHAVESAEIDSDAMLNLIKRCT